MSTCRLCAGDLETFLEFGPMPLADRFLLPEEIADEYFYDLSIALCHECSTIQLVEVPPADLVFASTYPYRSSGSAQMRAHFEAIAHRLLECELRTPQPFAVEIGCNDCAMLRVLANAGIRHLGVDPASDATSVAAGHGVDILGEFFSEATASRIHDEHGPADVVYAANTMCHIADLAGALRGIDHLLDVDGTFVFEDPYLGDILATTAFDQIYDEHVFYFSLRSVRRMVEPFGLEVFDVEHLSVHGGQLRYFIGRHGRRSISDAVLERSAAEDASCLVRLPALQSFSRRVETVQRQLRELLERLHDAGRRVVGYGATAKSATVTNACGIGPDLVEFVCDSTPEKQGRLSPGAHIPVRSPAAFADAYPDYALLFAWNHASEIRSKELAFEASGGRWILYVPEVSVIGG